MPSTLCGKWIAIEGGEGVGKSTLTRFLKSRFQREGYDVWATSAPGGTEIGAMIRPILKAYGGRMSPKAEEYLFAADLAELSNEAARRTAVGQLVLSDRSPLSQRVYSTWGKGNPKSYEEFSRFERVPDLTIVLEMSIAEMVRRVEARGVRDHYDAVDLAFHHRVQAGFREASKDDPTVLVERIDTASMCAVANLVEERVFEVFRKTSCFSLSTPAAQTADDRS